MSLFYWFFSASIALISLTWQDYTHNMLVDDRRNWIMIGLSISILSHVTHSIFYLFTISLLTALLNLAFTKFKLVGEADINTLSWLFLGIGLISLPLLAVYNIIFSACALFYIMVKRYAFKNKEFTAFYGVFLISWALFCLIYYVSKTYH